MKSSQYLSLIAFILSSNLVRSHAQTLDLDPNFGDEGIWITTEKISNRLNILPDQSILLSGARPSTGIKSDGMLTKLKSTGVTDSTFGTLGYVQIAFDDLSQNYYPYESFIASSTFSDGRIIAVGGKSGQFSDLPVKIIIAVFHSNGQIDSSFGNAGRRLLEFEGLTSRHIGILNYSNGDILVYSVLSVIGESEKKHLYLLRLNSDGNPVISFGPNGDGTAMYLMASDSPFNGLSSNGQFILTKEDKLLVGGTVASQNGFAVHRYHSNGLIDQDFGSNGHVLLETGFGTEVFDLDLQPDGKIVVFGSIRFAGDPNCVIIRLDAEGTMDPSWADQGVLRQDISFYENSIEQGVVQSDGKMLVLANRVLEDGSQEKVWMRYLPNGLPDLNFGTDGVLVFSLGDEAVYNIELKITSDHAVWLSGRQANNGVGIPIIVKYWPENYVSVTTPNSNPSLDALLFPNIAFPGQHLTLRYSLPNTGVCAAQLLDAQGKMMQNFGVLDHQTAGTHSCQLQLHPDLPVGLYHLILQTQDAQTSLPVVLKR